MRDADKNRDPQKAQKRALADARCAWRKMGATQRNALLQWIADGCTGDPCISVDVESWKEPNR